MPLPPVSPTGHAAAKPPPNSRKYSTTGGLNSPIADPDIPVLKEAKAEYPKLQ
jgi:hypothetical protein